MTNKEMVHESLNQAISNLKIAEDLIKRTRRFLLYDLKWDLEEINTFIRIKNVGMLNLDLNKIGDFAGTLAKSCQDYIDNLKRFDR